MIENGSNKSWSKSAPAALIQIGVYMTGNFLFSSAWYVKWTDLALKISEEIVFPTLKTCQFQLNTGGLCN